MTIDGAHARRWGARREGLARTARSLAPVAAGLVLWAAGIPGFAQSPVRCGSGSVIAVRFATSPAQVQRLADAECLVLAGAKARGAGAPADPFVIQVVDQDQGERVNAQYLTPGFTGTGHMEVTHDLLATYSADELAFVLAHETAHALGRDGLVLLGLQALVALCSGVAIGLSIYAVRAKGWTGLRQFALKLVAAAGAGVATITVSSALVAAFNTRIEYAADASGLRFLVAAGWSPARARAAFEAFVAKDPSRPAGSWLDLRRHPSQADRARAVQALAIGGEQR